MNLLLIGYRGTGKTTVAQHLGLALGWDWVDADVEIELRAGKSIQAIFADDGEPAFRKLESAVLTDLLSRDRQVLALGGGVVVRSENRQCIQEARKLAATNCGAARVIWLTADAETLFERITADATTAARRPNLTAGGGIDEVRRLLREREPWYRECADLIVDTGDKSPDEISHEIQTWLNHRGADNTQSKKS